ncbi:TraB/GumN family protein [Riemerella columbipharyngis]|uniref:Uncharacterized conserved protein YbaP, TraB family n=1 Tax=Riemerella columbipharyngis TaxID=1071918 RepID=A0A1G7FRC8_9FLAO|nr:TraB/GumN family protein [Riemerella columbipharyngis]SDE78450.1 Uncharacterized conserved protein YbaP, TraB family [Riemerella columbipharyngis]
MKALSLVAVLLSGISFSQSSMVYKIEKENQKPSYIYLNSVTCGDNQYLKRLEKDVIPNVSAISVEANLNSNKNKATLQNFIQVTEKEQKAKNILSVSDYQKLVGYVQEAMGVNEQMVNMFKPFYVNAVLGSLDNPCGTVKGENINVALEKYAEKKELSYSELLSISEYVTLMDVQDKNYWNKNISYKLNKSNEIKEAVKQKNKAYNNGNMVELENIYTKNPYFNEKNTDKFLKDYLKIIVPKIEKQTAEKPTLFTIGVEYAVNGKQNILDVLKSKGYKLTEM